MAHKEDIKTRIEQLRIIRIKANDVLKEAEQKLITENLSTSSQQILKIAIKNIENARNGNDIKAIDSAIADLKKVIESGITFDRESEKIEKQKLYRQHLTKGDEYLKNKHLNKAFDEYKEALNINETDEINQKIKDVRQLLLEYTLSITKGDTHFNNGNIREAVKEYEIALKIYYTDEAKRKHKEAEEKIDEQNENNETHQQYLTKGKSISDSKWQAQMTLIAVRKEAETLLAQANKKMSGFLTDAQKTKLANAINKLNKTYKGGDISAISTTIEEVKAVMSKLKPPPHQPGRVIFILLLLGLVVAFVSNYEKIIPLFQPTVKQWKIGRPHPSDIIATFDVNNGKLTMSGRGKMQDFQNNHKSLPWHKVKDKIKSVDINSGITTIGNNAFLDCISLTSVNIPDGITKIGQHSFMACNNLTSIIIPSSVTNIDLKAFYLCTSLADVSVNWTTPISLYDHVFGGINLDNVKLYIPLGTQRTYSSAAVWKKFKLVEIPIGIGTWNLTGRDAVKWTAKIVVQSVEKNKFKGYFDWYRNGNRYSGREYYEGIYDEKTRGVILQGTRLENANGIAIGIYKATVSTNGKELTKGTWGGTGTTTSGTWKATLVNK